MVHNREKNGFGYPQSMQLSSHGSNGNHNWSSTDSQRPASSSYEDAIFLSDIVVIGFF